MERRAFLATAAGVLGAGCLGGGSEETPTVPPTPTDTPRGTPTAETDGYPPEPETTPTERAVDASNFRTKEVHGIEVPLVPVNVAHYWHRRRAARFADARGQEQYASSRVLGAVLSTAPDGVENDPVALWPTDDRIVTYCGCPHHLSTLRAAVLIDQGYESVYVIDEGFWEWHDRGYPMAGKEVTEKPALRVVRGRADPAHAGEMVRLVHEPTHQHEAAPIDEDGRYELHVRFADVTTESVVTLHTPTGSERHELGALTEPA
jgi:rhodanese-related sulfurtransferase